MIPKSLHTVRVLAVMARQAMEADPTLTDGRAAVERAARLLGYGDADPYGLKEKAALQVMA